MTGKPQTQPNAPEEVDFEVLPPATGRDGTDLSRLVAWILDDLVRIPGTNFRVGLDPVVGMIPGVGDGSTAIFASVILMQSLRAGVPRIVIVRMALNILINALFGVVPGLGDLFSAWFKSNRRNYELLQKHAGSSIRNSTRGDWIFVVALISVVLAICVGISLFVAVLTIRLIQLMWG